MTLEKSFERLEQIIEAMEKGNATLDESFKLYQEGIKLAKDCNKQLDKVEKQIIVIGEKEDSKDE